jgi:hypothetical protein
MTDVSSLYLLAGGQTPVVTRVLSVLAEEFPFEKIAVLEMSIGTCRVTIMPDKSFGDQICDYHPILSISSGESEWIDKKNRDSVMNLYDDLALNYFGCSMKDLPLNVFIAFTVAHLWCCLLQIEGEYGVTKRRVITPIDSFNEKLMRHRNAEVLRLANIEANAWAYEFICSHWDKVSLSNKTDRLIETFRKEV